MARKPLLVSNEAINHQPESMLFKDLVINLRDIVERENKNAMTNQEVTKVLDTISKIIQKRVGVNANVTLGKENFANAWVFFPDLDRNNPVLTDYHRHYNSSTEGLKALKKNKGSVLKGEVDRVNSKVSGVFSKLDVKIVVTKGLIFDNYYKFTAEEVAAIIIHEIGHVFTYFEHLGTMITTNYILQHTSRSLMNERELVRQYEIIGELEDVTGIKVDDKDALIKAKNETIVQTVILRQMMQKRVSELDSKTYDLTAWEMLSDQFATRHGAGKYNVTVLDKTHRSSGDLAYMSSFGFGINNLLNLLSLLFITVITAGIMLAVLIIFGKPTESLYDNTFDRFSRIKRDMVDSLKNPKLDSETKKRIASDIEDVDKIINGLTNRKDIFTSIWLTLNSKGRREYDQMTFQHELEQLANNDLFVKAAKLST
ncbi:MAG: hypothetical protein IBX57_00290 [Gammaproteobacteria bacterium]|nr:hypothetical protein [Gammaproteobacteria bacterium]